jgi:hypothetical protein
MLVVKKASSNDRQRNLTATDGDDTSGKGGVLVATVTHDELVILGRLAGAIHHFMAAQPDFARTRWSAWHPLY